MTDDLHGPAPSRGRYARPAVPAPDPSRSVRVDRTVVVRWQLTAATCHLLSELSWWTGTPRSRITATLLGRALFASDVGAGSVGDGWVARPELRVAVRLHLPADLVVALERRAEGTGMPVEVLVELLAARYLTDHLAEVVRQRLHPLLHLQAQPAQAVGVLTGTGGGA